MEPTLDIADLEVRYGQHVALSGVTMALERPTSLAIIGPNGSGKSTLLSAIAGLAPPATGSVRVRSSLPVALVLQSTDVERSLPITVRDTVAMARYPGLGLLRRFSAADRRAVDRALERLDIVDLAGSQLHGLSGGQRQRVLVAQGLAQDTDVLLLDEPVTGLDVVSRQLILDIVDEERDAGRLVAMTTHNLEDARRCDQVLLLNTRPVAFGPPAVALSDEHLHEAYGGRVLRLGDEVLLDDPHHEHRC